MAQVFKTFAWIFGTFLILLSGGLIVTYVGEIITGTTRHGVASQLGLIAFLCGLVFVGMKLINAQLIERQAVKEIQEEQAILSQAKLKGGTLTISSAALDCKMRISDTKKVFERLAQTGICRVDVNDAGELYYWFPTFEPKQIDGEAPTHLLAADSVILNTQTTKSKKLFS